MKGGDHPSPFATVSFPDSKKTKKKKNNYPLTELTLSGFESATLSSYFGVSAELQLLEHLWNHENKFETGIVRANEC